MGILRITPEVAQDRERLGDLAGLDVVHLQCHLGTDTVSLSRLGARRVVGVDLSPGSLRRARTIAERAGAAIEFVEANVYDAREAVEGSFDLVYTSLGVLCWLPDVTAWARVIASLLRPGGRFPDPRRPPDVLTVGEDVSEALRIEQPYFQRRDPMTRTSRAAMCARRCARVRPRGQPPVEPFDRGDPHRGARGRAGAGLLRRNAVLGLVPVAGADGCEGERFRLREDPDRLALQFVLTAHRPG